MKTLTNWFLDNPVAANLLMVFILVAGLLSLPNLRIESFPSIEPNQLIISVVYPGGTARQVDEGITQRIEEAISSVPGIKRVRSSSTIGYAEITVRKNPGTHLDRLMENVRNQVDGIVGFPTLAERPMIQRDEFGNLAAFVILYSEAQDSPQTTNQLLQHASSRLQQALKKHPHISHVDHLGKRKPQLVIEPDLQRLRQYGLDLEQLEARIQRWSLEYRSGELNTARGRITLEGGHYADNLQALAQMSVINNERGSVRLGDIASIRRDFESNDSIVRFQGKPAVALMISTSTKDHLLKVSEATQSVIQQVKASLPPSVDVAVMADMSPYIVEQLALLGTNAWQGLLIVLVLLGLFLELKLAFWVALGIPISLSGALWLMGLPGIGYSLNDITLFGMILVLGVLVDDAVVVGESIHDARQRIADPKMAAREGVNAVSVATLFGVLTTIAAFSPMLWIENELAKVLAGFSAVVIFALIFSLIDSKFILPAHLAYADKPPSNNAVLVGWRWLRAQANAGLNLFADAVYQPLIRLSLTHTLTALMLFGLFFLLSWGLLSKGHIRSVFFPEIPGRYGTLTITMDQDAPAALTHRNIHPLEQALDETNQQLQQEFNLLQPPIKQYIVSMDGPRKLEMTAELSKQALADMPSKRFLDVWQTRTGQIEGSDATRFTLADEPAGGTSISVAAADEPLAQRIVDQLKQQLGQQPGVQDIYDNGQHGRRRLALTLNERGIRLGLDQRQLAVIAGGVFGQLDIHRLLLQGEETSVLLRVSEQHRKSIEQLKATPILVGETEADHSVRLEDVAEFEFSRQPTALHRINRERVISVYWRQDRHISSPEHIWKALQTEWLPRINALYPDVTITPQGEFAEINDVQSGFRKAMILTLLLIYVLLAIPLKSYTQPLVIMSIIPFGFAGAILGHGLMGLPVSLLSLFGMMALTGVVINDSLVMMTRFNQLHRDGTPLNQALIEAGRSRFKAIFLTTVTTVCGLIPLLLESSEQAQYLKPAAVSIVFGELLATPITLILIPLLLKVGSWFGGKSHHGLAHE